MSNMLLMQNQPVLSILLWAVLAIVLLFMARSQAHGVIRGGCRVLANALRLASRSVLAAERKLGLRNREVLLAAGEEEVEKEVAREFHRVEAVVRRDLQGYPAFHRQMSDLVTRIDEDYRQSTEVPPPPPGWVTAVETMAKLPGKEEKMVSGVLTEIHKTVDRQFKTAMDEYRKASSVRHGLLAKMMPFWRRLAATLEDVGKTITGLQERAAVIDRRMDEYDAIRANADRAVRKLSSSSLTQFFISGLVLLIAIGGAIINFNLIALPMSEMVGGGSYIGPFKTSNVAALVIILVEVAMGLFLMESLRITRLFPIISSMDDRMRRRMIWISFGILFTLAGVESALAFMRDRIAADIEALRQTLAGVQAVSGGVDNYIPMIGQMVMGFVLPFALTFVAIPLESFIHSSRTVLGLILQGSLRTVATVLRVMGLMVHYLGRMLINTYDLLIFPLLWIDQRLLRGRQAVPAAVDPKKEASR